MSVQDLDKIDMISTHIDGYIVLTISDHLEWDKESDHLFVLQSKLNNYLDFIESGQLETEYPNAKGKQIRIQIIAQHTPDDHSCKFLQSARATLQSIGYNLHIGFLENGEIVIKEIE